MPPLADYPRENLLTLVSISGVQSSRTRQVAAVVTGSTQGGMISTASNVPWPHLGRQPAINAYPSLHA